jgi:hypothetical protein
MCTEGAATKFEIDFEILWQPFKKKGSVKNAFRVLIRQFWKILNRILGTHFKNSLR